MGDTKEEERKRMMENILNEHYSKIEEEQVECIDLEDDEDEHNFEETVFVGVEPEKSKPNSIWWQSQGTAGAAGYNGIDQS